MKTLSAPLTAQKDAAQSGWVELYDIYLKAPVAAPAPWGTISTLRIAAGYGADFVFFTPTIEPEPAGTQGDVQTYRPWPIRREFIKSNSKSANDKLSVIASNVTKEWAQMLAAVSWYDVWFVIRKASTTLAGVPTADDCGILFIGRVDGVPSKTLQTLQFTLSNDLGNLTSTAPRENVHQNCRFNLYDDQCTVVRFLPENYKVKEADAGSTTSRVVSADLNEDGAAAGYIAQAVTADSATDKITLNAHGLNNGDRVRFAAAVIPGGLTVGLWYWVRDKAANDFKLALTETGAAIDITSNGTTVTMDSTSPYGTDLVDALADAAVTSSAAFAGYAAQAVDTSPSYDIIMVGTPGSIIKHQLSTNDVVRFAGAPLPTGIAAATDYYVQPENEYRFKIALTPGGAAVDFTTSGTAVTITSQITYAAAQVRKSNAGYWRLPNTTDWGTLANGFWQIPDAQAGLANAALKPYIQFDFGSAKTPRFWRLGTIASARFDEIVRLLVFFSSADAATWTFEHYFEFPPRADRLWDVQIPKASTKRYWRICVRSYWSETLGLVMLDRVEAYENARNWWAAGRITFDAATPTVALRSVSRKIISSYSGSLDCDALPVAPAAGDDFVVERGCPRTFNACAERRNTENFGGFLDLPIQSIIR